MIIRGTPKNLDKYIKVDSKTTVILHLEGYQPCYIDNEYVYYKKTYELLKFMEKEDLKWQK